MNRYVTGCEKIMMEYAEPEFQGFNGHGTKWKLTAWPTEIRTLAPESLVRFLLAPGIELVHITITDI